MTTRLFAKSWDFQNRAMPQNVFLDRHLRDVFICAKAIASATGDNQLLCFGLQPDNYRERFERILLVSAACHDLGKANSHFQTMLSGRKSNPLLSARQAVRHEWVTWFLLCQKEMTSWIKSKLDKEFSEVDWHLVLWSITGHHPAYGRSIPHERAHGSSNEIELYQSHADFQSCLNVVAESIGETQCPVHLSSQIYSAESDILSAIRESYADSALQWRRWRNRPNEERRTSRGWWREWNANALKKGADFQVNPGSGSYFQFDFGFRVASLTSFAPPPPPPPPPPSVPEPSTLVIGTLFGLGGLLAKRRIKR